MCECLFKKSRPVSHRIQCVHMSHDIDAGVHMRQIDALGISTQRGTFTTWDRYNDHKLYHSTC